MSSRSSLKQLCEKYFGTNNLYEAISVKPSASSKEIKKAYHKLSLLVHPDRVDDNEKEIATEKFKVLGKIHSVLQDNEKRKSYDNSGDIDEELDCGFNWMEYWKTIFKPIDIKDIENYEKNYIGSDTELRDIKKAYVATKGDINRMLEMIPFSNCNSEPRFHEIIQKMVDNNEVEKYIAFFNEPTSKKNRRKAKWEQEKKEAEDVNWEALEEEIKRNSEKRQQKFFDLVSDIKASSNKKRKITNGSKAPRKKKQKI